MDPRALAEQVRLYLEDALEKIKLMRAAVMCLIPGSIAK